MKEVILAIDGGGSRTRCAAIDLGGQMLGIVEAGPSNHLIIERELAAASVSDAVNKALFQCNLQRADVLCVSAGFAGVDYDGTGEEEMRDILRGTGFGRLAINGDMVIAHAGAFAGKPGVMALAGTGSSILGLGKNGERVKVGGWGPVFGDEGSAYRIGQSALRAAARDFDGRGEKTALTSAILDAFGITDFKETLNLVYFKRSEAREIAALSRTVCDVAEKGDAIAMRILREAGDELAECVAAAVERLSSRGDNVEVSYQGSVLESCRIVRKSFEDSVTLRIPGAKLVRPRYPPVVGAFLLGRSSLDLPEEEAVFDTLGKQNWEQ